MIKMINLKKTHKIPVAFHNLKNYDSHLIMQELGKFDFWINVISNGLEKYMSFNADNTLMFIDGFQCLSFSLDNLSKNLSKNDLKYLSQESYNDVLHLVKKKVVLKSLKSNYQAKESFIVCWQEKKLVIKSVRMFHKLGFND